MQKLKAVMALQNLSRVSSSGGSSIVGRQSSFGAKALLASKRMQEPSAKFPVPAPKTQQMTKVSARGQPDSSDLLPGAKPVGKPLEGQKILSSSIGGRGKSGVPRISK